MRLRLDCMGHPAPFDTIGTRLHRRITMSNVLDPGFSIEETAFLAWYAATDEGDSPALDELAASFISQQPFKVMEIIGLAVDNKSAQGLSHTERSLSEGRDPAALVNWVDECRSLSTR